MVSPLLALSCRKKSKCMTTKITVWSNEAINIVVKLTIGQDEIEIMEHFYIYYIHANIQMQHIYSTRYYTCMECCTHTYMYEYLSSGDSHRKIYLLPYLHEHRFPHLFSPSAKVSNSFSVVISTCMRRLFIFIYIFLFGVLKVVAYFCKWSVLKLL